MLLPVSFIFSQHFQALQVQSFVIQYPGIIHLLMQLDIDIIFLLNDPEAGKIFACINGPLGSTVVAL